MPLTFSDAALIIGIATGFTLFAVALFYVCIWIAGPLDKDK